MPDLSLLTEGSEPLEAAAGLTPQQWECSRGGGSDLGRRGLRTAGWNQPERIKAPGEEEGGRSFPRAGGLRGCWAAGAGVWPFWHVLPAWEAPWESRSSLATIFLQSKRLLPNAPKGQAQGAEESSFLPSFPRPLQSSRWGALESRQFCSGPPPPKGVPGLLRGATAACPRSRIWRGGIWMLLLASFSLAVGPQSQHSRAVEVSGEHTETTPEK